jgi:hypothetical protein
MSRAAAVDPHSAAPSGAASFLDVVMSFQAVIDAG